MPEEYEFPFPYGDMSYSDLVAAYRNAIAEDSEDSEDSQESQEPVVSPNPVLQALPMIPRIIRRYPTEPEKTRFQRIRLFKWNMNLCTFRKTNGILIINQFGHIGEYSTKSISAYQCNSLTFFNNPKQAENFIYDSPNRSSFFKDEITVSMAKEAADILFSCFRWNFDSFFGQTNITPVVLMDVYNPVNEVGTDADTLRSYYGDPNNFSALVNDILVQIGDSLMSLNPSHVKGTLGLIERVEPCMKEEICGGDDNQNEEDCSICFEGYKADKVAMVMQCSHKFHRKCLVAWVLDKDSCPLCRRPCGSLA